MHSDLGSNEEMKGGGGGGGGGGKLSQIRHLKTYGI